MRSILLTLIGLSIIMSACQNTTTATTKKHPKAGEGDKEYNAYLEQKNQSFVGKPIASIALKTTEGKSYNTATIKDKIVLLNFWFKECKPCITEIPSLNQLQQDFESKGVMVLGVSLDSEEKVKATMKEKNMKYQNVANGKWVAKKLEVMTYPTTFLIDKKGIIRHVFTGASSFDATQTYTEIKPYLNKMIQN